MSFLTTQSQASMAAAERGTRHRLFDSSAERGRSSRHHSRSSRSPGDSPNAGEHPDTLPDDAVNADLAGNHQSYGWVTYSYFQAYLQVSFIADRAEKMMDCYTVCAIRSVHRCAESKVVLSQCVSQAT